ncbi:peptidase C15, pyroglutamyl peptidase I-like protein [Corynespora cassiicola Philippines]|uniref:Peptidase C15, pyroglutamyl peptidase I-like protein n=1 Tax=Corynespora cassiicola Philippines TaxID=1448308 RepID=A0A2T2NBE6_CORCC|nr:peptidase C15, pyroglutamyl peptidase I-like protein [Corynespora cassiicola Philippines]
MPRTAETYAARQPPSEKGEDPVTVMVTGFGPFLTKYPRNTSWEIASTLPALLPATPDSPTPIHIHVHHAPIRVAYHTVTSLIPRLLPPTNPIHPAPDIILHIGLAAGRTYYTLERGAHARGYGAIPDVDGRRFADDEAEATFPRALFPPVLHTSFAVEDVVARWEDDLRPAAEEARKKPDVRPSPDAGNFMCGFIYYNSLAHYFSLDEAHRPVAFLHVPDLTGGGEGGDGCEFHGGGGKLSEREIEGVYWRVSCPVEKEEGRGIHVYWLA